MQSDFLLLRGSLLHFGRFETHIQSNNINSWYEYLLNNTKWFFITMWGLAVFLPLISLNDRQF